MFKALAGEASSECRSGNQRVGREGKGAERAWRQTFRSRLDWDEAVRQAQPSQRMTVLWEESRELSHPRGFHTEVVQFIPIYFESSSTSHISVIKTCIFQYRKLLHIHK